LKAERFFILYHALVETLNHLKRHGRTKREGIVYWIGKKIENGKVIVTSVIYPKQRASVIRAKVEPSEVARITARLHRNNEILVAQIHSHPTFAFHSDTDDLYPVFHEVGLISVVVSNFGFIKTKNFFESRFFEYLRYADWHELDAQEVKNRFIVLPKNFDVEFFDRTKLLIKELNMPTDQALSKLRKSKVAIALDENLLDTYKGQNMLFASANLLLRCGINLDIFLSNPRAETLETIPLLERTSLQSNLETLCLKINPNQRLRINLSCNKYDVLLCVGNANLAPADHYIYINANNWLAYVSTKEQRIFNKDSLNPLGPLGAACYGSSEVIKRLLNKNLGSKLEPIEQLTFSLLDYKLNQSSWHNPSFPEECDSGQVVMVGTGAVGMSVAYALASMPASCDLIPIDFEDVAISNLNRYSLATIVDIGTPKVEVVKNRLRGRLNVRPFNGKYEQYVYRNHLDLVVAAVDNVDTRMNIEKDSTNVILNGGMYGLEFVISRHEIESDYRLHHLYPSYTRLISSRKYPAVSFVSMLCGTMLASEIVKERVKELRSYKLDNTLVVNNMFSIPIRGTTWLHMRLKGEEENTRV